MEPESVKVPLPDLVSAPDPPRIAVILVLLVLVSVYEVPVKVLLPVPVIEPPLRVTAPTVSLNVPRLKMPPLINSAEVLAILSLALIVKVPALIVVVPR